MSEHYDFHYQPTGSGAISGQQVLQQTEDAINELGDYVNDNVGGAMDVAQQALETAQNAEQDAQTALDTANSFSSAIQSAQQDASTALSTAQTAQTTASNANNTAIQAQQDANTAVTTANNASGQVSTLSGTVTTLGQRVTTAEGNIGQNTSDITALTTRIGTAEGNITTLQNDVTIAQGNASSAMATAGTVKQQAYVFRYSSTALVASSTNSNTLLDNTDNLKVGDKVIDSSGVLFSITAIDNVNSTFTIGSALVDLALDANVVHTSGNETVGGSKTFTGTNEILRPSGDHKLKITDTRVTPLDPTESITSNITWQDSTGRLLGTVANVYDNSRNSIMQLYTRSFNANGEHESHKLRIISNKGGNSYADVDVNFLPSSDNKISLGSSTLRWNGVYATNYYYGSNNVEFSTKFVTTDTNQTISGNKNFEGQLKLNAYSWVIRYKTQGTSNYPNYNTFKQIEYNKYNNIITLRRSADVLDSGDNFNVVDTSFAFYKIHVRSKYVDLVDNTRFLNDGTNNYVVPLTDNTTYFGSSSNKWKDVQTYKVNGLEPSALSLPSGNVSDVIDISSYLVNLDGRENTYTAPANGWISIAISGTAISIISAPWSDSRLRPSDGPVRMLYPIIEGMTMHISVVCTTLAYARFIPCQGNV